MSGPGKPDCQAGRWDYARVATVLALGPALGCLIGPGPAAELGQGVNQVPALDGVAVAQGRSLTAPGYVEVDAGQSQAPLPRALDEAQALDLGQRNP